jgi:Cft2 family RNA processing exonuclease
MVDAGITPGDKSERLLIPTGIDALILSHGHVDHVGELPQFWIQNPNSRIFTPK